jgi:TPR repeat protein
MHGYGVPASHASALQLFQKAAERGNAEAQVRSGAGRKYVFPKLTPSTL